MLKLEFLIKKLKEQKIR